MEPDNAANPPDGKMVNDDQMHEQDSLSHDPVVDADNQTTIPVADTIERTEPMGDLNKYPKSTSTNDQRDSSDKTDANTQSKEVKATEGTLDPAPAADNPDPDEKIKERDESDERAIVSAKQIQGEDDSNNPTQSKQKDEMVAPDNSSADHNSDNEDDHKNGLPEILAHEHSGPDTKEPVLAAAISQVQQEDGQVEGQEQSAGKEYSRIMPEDIDSIVDESSDTAYSRLPTNPTAGPSISSTVPSRPPKQQMLGTEQDDVIGAEVLQEGQPTTAAERSSAILIDEGAAEGTTCSSGS
jgi:hypothetical protein